MLRFFTQLCMALIALALIVAASTMAAAETVSGSQSKHLLVRDEDVQVLHGCATVAVASACLVSDLFTHDVVGDLGPLLAAAPKVRIHAVP